MALQKNYIACLLSDFASVIMDVHDLELEKKQQQMTVCSIEHKSIY